MMTQAFYTGISGLKTNQYAIDVTSDNLANVSTNGFRGYMAGFTSLFEDTLNSASASSSVNSSVGIGAQLNSTTMNTLNGSLALSDKSTDLAINGEGWFGIQGNGETRYTRDGNFSFDANSDLVTQDGYYLLGTMGGNITGDSTSATLSSVLTEVPLGNVSTQTKLQFPQVLTYPYEASTNAQFFANVGVGTDPVTVGAAVIDPTGTKNHLRLEFTKQAVQTPPGSQWDVVATTQTLDGTTIYDTQTGTVNFDDTGALISTTLSSIDNNGAAVSIDLGTGYSGIVSLNRTLESGSSIADGTIGGELAGYEISQNGEVIAAFTNGRQSSVGKIAVYHFQNDQGLDRISGTRFARSNNSGNPMFYQDANGNNITGSQVLNYRLEGSNVQMSTALTELIIYQRAYDANSKSITTADQMMQKALNMDA